MPMLQPDRPVPPPSMEIMQPFEIPTNVTPTVRTGPRPQLEFPVFRPPTAGEYGSTQPITVPWHPPDLAGAINQGLQTGASLATSFLTNRKTAQEIQAEEAVAKPAIAAMNDPRMAAYRGFSVGPGGFTGTLISPAEAALRQAQIASEQARTAASQAETAERYGTTEPAKSKLATEEQERAKSAAETIKTQQQTVPGFFSMTNIPPPSSSGFIQRPPATDQTGASAATTTDQGNGNSYLNLGF